MEKKLALLLGVLLLLPMMAHFFGADFQVKANETRISDHENSDDLGSRRIISSGKGSSSGSSDSNSGSKDGVVVVVEGNKDQVGVDDESKLSVETNPKTGVHVRKIVTGLDIQRKPKKVIKKVNEKPVEGSKKGFDKDYDSEAGNDESEGSDGTVGQKENAENKENEDRGDGSKGEAAEKKGDPNGHSELGESGNDKGDGVDPGAVKKEISSGDYCYSSYKCSDKENQLIACLRVPGNDSPRLSLLIQNKGNDSLTVDISVPDFVKLESTKVQLQKRENKQVDVSIGNGGKQSLIVLTSGDRVCNLDFKDLMASHEYKYLHLPARRPTTLVFLSFSALLIVASVWTCLNSRRRKLLSGRGVVAYQQLDAGPGLPVIAKQQPSENKRWDDSWGDDWDEEEAPRTPSKPSPSFSSSNSNRLASRRLTKETRKD